MSTINLTFVHSLDSFLHVLLGGHHNIRSARGNGGMRQILNGDIFYLSEMSKDFLQVFLAHISMNELHTFAEYEESSFTTILSCSPLSSVLLHGHIIHSRVRAAALSVLMPASTISSSTTHTILNRLRWIPLQRH